jgi:hypothetical protein
MSEVIEVTPPPDMRCRFGRVHEAPRVSSHRRGAELCIHHISAPLPPVMLFASLDLLLERAHGRRFEVTHAHGHPYVTIGPHFLDDEHREEAPARVYRLYEMVWTDGRDADGMLLGRWAD